MDELSRLQDKIGSLRREADRLFDAIREKTREIEELAQETQNAERGCSGLSSALDTLQSRTASQRDAIAPRGSLSHILTQLTTHVGSETQAQISNAAEAMETARRKESELRGELDRLRGLLNSIRGQISDSEHELSSMEAEG